MKSKVSLGDEPLIIVGGMSGKIEKEKEVELTNSKIGVGAGTTRNRPSLVPDTPPTMINGSSLRDATQSPGKSPIFSPLKIGEGGG